MQRIRQRRGVGDGRNRSIGKLAFQQPPGIGRFLRRFGKRGPKRETPRRNKRVGGGENPRILRLIEIQTARILARSDPEAGEGHAGQRLVRLEQVGDVHQVPAARARWIVSDRQQRVGQEGIATGAGLSVDLDIATFPTERVDRDNDERGRRDQRDTQYASTGSIGGVPEPEL